jgi:hypothetical protein
MLAIAGGVVWGGYLLLVYGLSQLAGQNYSIGDLAIPGKFTLGNPAPDKSLTGSVPGGTGTGPGTVPFNPKTGTGGNPTTYQVCRDKSGANVGKPVNGKCPKGQTISYLQA